MANPGLDELWALLRNVQVLQFKSQSHTGIGWEGAGTGAVKVSEAEPDILLFEESGRWRQSGGQELRFTNVYRWSKAENVLRLEHLRFGPNNPVFLFEMAPDEDGIWRDVNPHPCRDDCYSAALSIERERIRLNWTVSGPKRNELIDYIYI